MNKQPISKKIRFDGYYQVNSIFLTIQGEGPFTGERAIFIRLAGCNLQCPMCDTEYTESKEMSLGAIFQEVHNKIHPRSDAKNPPLVVITGGEPLRQDLYSLITMLNEDGYAVQIETNGTLPLPKGIVFRQNAFPRSACAYVVCAPKTGSVHATVNLFACAFKYVLHYTSVGIDGLPIKVLDHSVAQAGRVARPPRCRSLPIYLQPADTGDKEVNAKNLAAVKTQVIAHGYILQLQTHKIIGVE